MLHMNDCHFCTSILVVPNICEGKQPYIQVMSKEKIQLKTTMQHSLYLKYASSQNYHYTKELNEILTVQRTSATIRYRDMVCYDESGEQCLNRYYNSFECKEKLAMLGEYYKFHNEIPRMFMLPAIVTLNWFHDRKRRLEYFRIAKMIEEENKNNPDKPPKGIVGDSPVHVRESENMSEPNNETSSDMVESKVKKGRILDELSWMKSEPPPAQPVKPITEQANQTKQQIQNLKKVFSERLAITQNKHNMGDAIEPKSEQMQRPAKFDKQIQESLDLNNMTGRNQSSRVNNPSDRTIQQNQLLSQKNLRQTTRPSLRNILSIIKNTPSIEARKNAKHKQLKVEVDPSDNNHNNASDFKSMTLLMSQDSMINTPRQINLPFSIKEKSFNKKITSKDRNNPLHISNTLNSISKQSVDFKSKPSPTQMIPNRSQIPHSIIGNITPRNNLVNQNKIKPKQPVPARSKVQMLELKVLTDIQQLQNKKFSSQKSKKNCTLQLDSVSRNMDPRSLTQRVMTSQQTDFNSMRLKSIYTRKKKDQLKYYPSGTQSHRDKLGRLEMPSKSSKTIYNQLSSQNLLTLSQQSTFPTNATNPTNPTQPTLNQSSCSPPIYHSKSQSFNKMPRPTIDLDSQLFKAAMNLAQRIQKTLAQTPKQKMASNPRSVSSSLKFSQEDLFSKNDYQLLQIKRQK